MTDREKENAIYLLENILKIPSINGSSREADVAEFLHKQFQASGIRSSIQLVDEKRANVIADIEGENPDVLHIWNGHLDTVPYGNLDEWKTDPAVPVTKEDKLYARGASDMKSGLAAMVYTLCLMKASGVKPASNIRFIGTCDEEKGGQGALKIIEEGLLGKPELMLIGEPTDCNIGIAQKGCLWIKLTVFGKTSHGAYPEKGINAVNYGVNICGKFREAVRQHSHSLLKKPTAEITSIKGGIAANMIPDYCELTMDVRIVPGLDLENTLEILEQICMEYEAQTEHGVKSSFTVLNERPAVNTDADDKYVALLKDQIEANDLHPELLGISYFTDASVFIREHSDMSVLLFGPGRADIAHKPDEYVEIKNYFSAIDILKNFYCVDPAGL